MKPIKSLGYRTDMIFRRFDAEIIERDDYTVVLTPSNPGFFWGNFLLFKEPPSNGSLAEWNEIFESEVASKLDVHHRAFGWDCTENVLGEHQVFLDAGYTLDQCVVQTAQSVHEPPKLNSDVEIRPLRGSEWDDVIEIQVACTPERFQPHLYRQYRQERMIRYREMNKVGLGTWFGAFLDGQIVADLGIFSDDEIGRFQHVETHPDFRRRAICSTMIYESSRYAFEQMGVETLVIAADVNYHAKEIYESVGFKPTEHQAGLQWFDPKYS